MGAWYCTREDVKSALESAETARNNARIDRAIETSSRNIDALCRRVFYPEVATRTFDWPDENQRGIRSNVLYLNGNDLASVTTLTSGGVVIPATDYFLRPDSGPPYTRIELDLDSSAAFGGGATHQRDISILGLWAHSTATTPAGTLAGSVNSSSTTIGVSDSSLIGVGSIVQVDSERMIVTGRQQLTTGGTLLTAMTNQVNNVIVQVAAGWWFNIDEVILINAEKMLIVDIAANDLIVKRAWDGTAIAAHTAAPPPTIYAPRTLVVQRGALGTTAAAHDAAAPIRVHAFPGPVRSLAIAESQTELLQQGSGYARTSGSGDNQREASGKALHDLRKQVRAAYGRVMRTRVV